jgi:hypothetical protein
METLKRLVPYAIVPPGYEAVFTGEVSPHPVKEHGWPVSIYTDEQGRVIQKWGVWTWEPGGDQAPGEEIQALNRLQAALGPLDDETRRLRAHIGSLVQCEAGLPVTIDELLVAIGRGRLGEQTFYNGCWCCSMWWESSGTQPGQAQAMQDIEACLTAYLAGVSLEELVRRCPKAQGFIRRTFAWLGPEQQLSPLKRLLLKRMLLPFEFYTWRKRDYDAVNRNCFEDGGQGQQLDEEIASLAGLPKIYPDYAPEFKLNLHDIRSPDQQALYRLCGSLAHGLHGLSDCHHSTFRWIENWIYDIGLGKHQASPRKPGSERQRLARLLFGYSLGLDQWLAGQSLQFLLLDLGHLDLGCDPKDEILRVYAYLGEDRTPVRQWLAACLWYSLSGGGNPESFVIQQDLLERARRLGINPRAWMDDLLSQDKL